uniref:non-specific serine/threonine protein kinase n=1 Tax=Nonomuraea gerenzanensis TaxID=93944 RepID=A0A1M4E2Z6_9ACTN|nr:Tyrosine protein kinase:Serine/threonine protein kinase [Nonomuraea gerenzanensis]
MFLGSRGGERYAVKLLHGPVGDERAAFLREVELAKHVARFCTAQVIDAGFDEGRPYIVSEYVDGPSLAREVTLTGPRQGGALERLAVSTATALAAIHRAGIVHRDFKPQNVLLGSDGPRVIDFGLAKALDAAATVSGRGVGTPAYMAPEQITALAVTGAADVFSWGATMCFAANASAPFGQDSVAPVLHRILTAPPELGRLDGRLRVLVESCLDKDARNRPSSRELLFELLGEATEGVPAEVLRSPPPHILRAPPPLIPEQRSPETHERGTGAGAGGVPTGGPGASGPGAAAFPMAEPEATGAPGGAYHLPSGADAPMPLPGSAAGRLPGAAAPGASPGGGTNTGEPPGAGGAAQGFGTDDGLRHGSGPGFGAGAAMESPPHGRRGWPRAAVAVCVALLATAAVLLTVIIPTINRNNAATPTPQAGGGPLTSEPITSPPSASAPSTQPPTRPKPQSRGPQEPSTSDPPTLIRPATAAIPPLIGLDRAAATQALERAGLTPGRITERDAPQRIGRILSTDPAPGTTVNQGTKVALQISAGLPVPALAGMQRKAAEAALARAGLEPGGITRSCSQQPDGQVLGTRPKAGRRVTGGTSVSLTVARNGSPAPSVVGRQREDARAALVAAGLSVQVREQPVEDEAGAGTVLAQSLSPGTCAKPGTDVTITVGVFAQPNPDPGETTPSPTTTGPIVEE